jgi:hypothetical protein
MNKRVKNILGLDEKEMKVMNKLMECYKAWLDLKRDHPNELSEFGYAVHLIQDLLAMRVVRRIYPEGWPTYSEEIKHRTDNLHLNIIHKISTVLKDLNKKMERIENKLRYINLSNHTC